MTRYLRIEDLACTNHHERIRSLGYCPWCLLRDEPPDDADTLMPAGILHAIHRAFRERTWPQVATLAEAQAVVAAAWHSVADTLALSILLQRLSWRAGDDPAYDRSASARDLSDGDGGCLHTDAGRRSLSRPGAWDN